MIVRYRAKKILRHVSVKLFTKKFRASISIRSRFWEDEVTRAIVSTPAILGNNSLNFASFSSRVCALCSGEYRTIQ
jgi:hypothetical protein